MYTNASDDACGAQLSQEDNGTEFPIAFLLHTFLETQRKWSTTEQEDYGVYCTITKWNYYLQGAEIIVGNGHKPLAKFLNGKNANSKVNRWGLELATYNFTFEWISGICNKAADCLSRLVELPQDKTIPVHMLTVTKHDGPTFYIRSQTHLCHSSSTPTLHPQPDITPDVSTTASPTPKSLTEDRLQTILQMQKWTPFAGEYPNAYQIERHLYMKLTFSTHQGTILQTCDRCQPEVPCPSYTKSLEIYSSGRSPWQSWSSRNHSYLLSHQVPILLEGYE